MTQEQQALNSKRYLAIDEPLRDLRWLCDIMEIIAETTYEAAREEITGNSRTVPVAIIYLERIDWLATYINRQAAGVEAIYVGKDND